MKPKVFRWTLIFVMAGFGILASIALAKRILSEMERSSQIKCKARLNHIGIALTGFAWKNENRFTSSFAELDNVADLNFICPSSGNRAGDIGMVGRWSDFVLLTNRLWNPSGECLLAYCRPVNHGGKGCGALLTDGSVHWISAVELSRLLEVENAVPSPESGTISRWVAVISMRNTNTHANEHITLVNPGDLSAGALTNSTGTWADSFRLEGIDSNRFEVRYSQDRITAGRTNHLLQTNLVFTFNATNEYFLPNGAVINGSVKMRR